VIDMHTIKPLDEELIERMAKSCGAIVTAEDHNIIGGLGGAVAEYLSSNIPTPLERVGVKDRFGESGQADEMFDLMEISSPHIASAAIRVINRKK
jgi:transketolase